MFSQSSFCKNEDPDAWITILEEFRMMLYNMGSVMTDDQFMVHVFNNLANDCELQMVLLEKRIGKRKISLKLENYVIN
jgi:hypothetical protein